QPDRVWCVSFSPDGKSLASVGFEPVVKLWEVAPRKPAARRALTAAELDAGWTNLASDDATRAYQAIRALAGARGLAVPFLRNRLQPASGVAAGCIARLIADLDNDAFAVREKASAELARLGSPAEPALRKAMEGKVSAEVRSRLRALLDRREGA